MSSKFNNRLYNLIALLCFVSTSSAQTKTSTFYKVQDTTGVKLDNSTILQATSLTECSFNCLSRDCDCYSFDEQLKLCKTGVCVRSTMAGDPGKNLYMSCSKNKGFKYLTYGLVSACVWTSNSSSDWATAMMKCKAMGAKLYTLKIPDKLKLLQTFYFKIKLWVGLTYSANETVFKWQDDNTECNKTCQQELFAKGKPDGGDCVCYYTPQAKLDDHPCGALSLYICEKLFFNVY